MMGKIRLTVILQLLTTSSILYLSQANNREDLIEDSVRRLLGFKPGTARDFSPFGKNITLPPRYMMDLYEKYRSGQSPMQGNTVRSILPMRDSMGEADVLIFNLTGLNSNEKILQSKLYILKRKKPRHSRRREASFFRMKIGTLPNMTFHRYIDVSLSRQKSEWQSYDITNSVLHCRRTNAKANSLLGVTLEVKRSKNNFRLSPFRRLLKMNSQPFILIFSDDIQNQTRYPSRTKPKNDFDGLQDLLNAKAQSDDFLADDAFVSAEDSFASSEVRTKRSTDIKRYNLFTSHSLTDANKYFNTSTGHYESNNEEHSGRTGLLHRKMGNKYTLDLDLADNSLSSSIHSNIPTIEQYGDSDSSNDQILYRLLKVLSTNVNVLLENILNNKKTLKEIHNGTMPTVRHNVTKRSISNKLVYSTTFKDGPDATANTLQAVEEKETTNSTINSRKDRNRKAKKQKKRRRKLPFWWTKHDSKLHSKDYKNMCQRKSLVVDFTELGWGDWVMSPKSFNAHYCTGGCSFPLIKNTNPSNHAALQSLMHALGLHTKIPAPCCVPSSTSPLTLLYFDEHGSLVLKNYPDMIVKKCACR